ncbi:hypothetical protein L7F22_054016 [Adiantum nelumboides]|nr:hypothetical protein [Adiantum nelumboides]
MSSSSDLRRWIGDNAIRLFGVSDSTLVDFVQVSALGAKSSSDLYTKLSSMGLPASPESKAFVTQLYDRIPRPSSSKSQQAQSENAEKTTSDSKGKRYALLVDEDDGVEQLRIKPEKRKKKKSKNEEDSDRKEHRERPVEDGDADNHESEQSRKNESGYEI